MDEKMNAINKEMDEKMDARDEKMNATMEAVNGKVEMRDVKINKQINLTENSKGMWKQTRMK